MRLWASSLGVSAGVPSRDSRVIAIDERHLRAVLTEFADNYNRDRPHRSLSLHGPLPVDVRVDDDW